MSVNTSVDYVITALIIFKRFKYIQIMLGASEKEIWRICHRIRETHTADVRIRDYY